MADLVRIPWQRYYWLTPHTLALLVAASKRLGYNGTTTGLMLYAVDPRGLLSAWRSYEQQAELYQAFLNGGNAASNPDTGARMHMRGGAFDLVRTDLTAQNTCRAVGLIRDSDEKWHWNDPLGTSMPIIKTNTATAGGDLDPLNDRKESDMYRMILTKKGSTTAGNLYDAFGQYETLTGVTYAEAAAHQEGQNGKDGTLGSIDGTNTANAALVAGLRKLWARQQASNLANLRAVVASEAGGSVVVPPPTLPADVPPAWLEQIAQAVRDEIVAPD